MAHSRIRVSPGFDPLNLIVNPPLRELFRLSALVLVTRPGAQRDECEDRGALRARFPAGRMTSR